MDLGKRLEFFVELRPTAERDLDRPDPVDAEVEDNHRERCRAMKPFIPFEDENVEGSYMKATEKIWTMFQSIKDSDEHLPVPSEFFSDPLWKIDKFEGYKSQWNTMKSEIGTFKIESWNAITKKMETTGQVIPEAREKYRPEFGSQGWCKFFECLSTYQIIPQAVLDEKFPLCSVHLCEGSGVLIAATNHFIRSRCPNVKWDWLATSLNPHHEGNHVGPMISEDKQIFTSLKNWTFLKDGTGNIMNEDNIDFLIQEVEQRFQNTEGTLPVGLVTANGSIDCQLNPMEKEEIVSHLHFAEIVAGLLILGTGGTFVLKISTFLECRTICHLYLLSCLFDQVHLFKPATSREGKAEVYVICLGYFGKSLCLKQLMSLKKSVGGGDKFSQNNSLLPKHLILQFPFYFRFSLTAKLFFDYLMAINKRNVNSYVNYKDPVMLYFNKIIRTEIAHDWIANFDAVKLEVDQRLFGRYDTCSEVYQKDKIKEIGTFQDKIRRKTASALVRMQFIKKELRFFKTYGRTISLKSEILGNKNRIRLLKEKPYENILSSRFCFGKLLLHRQEVRDAVKPFASVLKKDALNSHIIENCSVSFLTKVLSKLPDIQKAVKDDGLILHRLCFHETIENLCFTNDMSKTRNELRSVLRQLNFMKRGDSLFLCEFPLLTRLHLGLMYAFSSIFEKVLVCLNRQKTVKGVLLHNFRGIKSSEDGKWLIEIAHAVMGLDGEKESVVLEVIPTIILANLINFHDILDYNLYNTAANLEEIITEAEKMIELTPKMPNAHKETSFKKGCLKNFKNGSKTKKIRKVKAKKWIYE